MDSRTNNRFGLTKVIPERTTRSRVEEKAQQRKQDRLRVMETNRNLPSQMNDTYTVPEAKVEPKTRTKLLELWRQQREEKRLQDKAAQKPVFKVSTTNLKQFDKLSSRHHSTMLGSTSMNRTNSSSNTSAASSSLPANPSSSSNAPVPRPLTRSQSRSKVNTSSDQAQPKSFVNTVAKSKFTFQATLYDQRQNKPIKLNEPSQPVRLTRSQSSVTTKPTNRVANTTHPTAPHNPTTTATAKTAPSKPVPVVKPQKPVAQSVIQPAPVMKYEEFCDNLFFKFDSKPEDDRDRLGVEPLDSGNGDDLSVKLNNLDLDKKVKWSRGCEFAIPKPVTSTAALTATATSYRKSKSGVYKINLQSSILEFEEERTCARIEDTVAPIGAVTKQVTQPIVPFDDFETSKAVQVEVPQDDFKTPNWTTTLSTVVQTTASCTLTLVSETPTTDNVTLAFELPTVQPSEQQSIEAVRKDETPIVQQPIEPVIVVEEPVLVVEIVKPQEVVADETARDDYYELNGEKRDVKFYRNLVVVETSSLNEFSAKWDCCVSDAPEDVQGEIRSAIGLAKLLIVERFDQFLELVDQCEFLTGDLPVKCSDLQGFWDMVDYQVIDVKKKFDKLEKLRGNNWVEEVVVPIRKAVVKEKKPVAAAPVKKAPVKSKFAAFKAQMLKGKPDLQESEVNGHAPVTEVDQENEAVKVDQPQEVAKLLTPVKSPLKTKQMNLLANEEAKKPRVSLTINLMNCETTPNRQPLQCKQPLAIDEEEDDDFLNLDSFRPICFRNSILRPLTMLNSDSAPQTPKTPRSQYRRSILNPSIQSSETVKSPLLKLAYISSHGKRLSRGGCN